MNFFTFGKCQKRSFKETKCVRLKNLLSLCTAFFAERFWPLVEQFESDYCFKRAVEADLKAVP